MRHAAYVLYAWDIRHSKSDPLLCLSSYSVTQDLVVQGYVHHQLTSAGRFLVYFWQSGMTHLSDSRG